MGQTTVTHDSHAAHGHDHHEQSFIMKYFFSTDHKIIGLQYMFTGMFMAIVGGYFAYAFRMQLAFPGMEVPLYGTVGPGEYNMLITNHGSIMIFWVAMPVLIAAFGNILIPLMIGCDDMVFPRLNRLSFQIFLLSVVVLFMSFFVQGGGFGGAWTSYPPLSAVAEYNLTDWGASLWLIAVALEFVAFLIGGINFVTTSMNARAPGMRMTDIPMVVWMIVLASIMFMASVGPLIAGSIMLLMDRNFGTAFFEAQTGGDPTLFQHLFWFFGHPEVYVVLLPALGIVAEIMTTFARKKLFGYKTILYTTFATGGLAFVVWAHHQFIAGIDPRMANIFLVTTLLISIPIAEILFSYIATLYGGSIEFRTPMLWALGFLITFLLGGVTETLGKIHFWGTIIPFNGIFLPLFLVGMAGQHRRIYNFQHFPDLATADLQGIRVFATVSMVTMLLFQFVFAYNFFVSMFKGEKAPANPWKSNTLEWTVPSPPPHGNFAELPTVYRGPYEYSVPGNKEDYWPQNMPDRN